MEYLHSFTVTVLTVSFLCFVFEALAPEGVLGKSMALVTGLVIALAIVQAALRLPLPDIKLPALTAQAEPADTAQNAVTAQFAADLAAAVEQSIFAEFGVAVTATAAVTCSARVLTIEALALQADAQMQPALTQFVQKQFGITPCYT